MASIRQSSTTHAHIHLQGGVHILCRLDLWKDAIIDNVVVERIYPTPRLSISCEVSKKTMTLVKRAAAHAISGHRASMRISEALKKPFQLSLVY